MRSDFANPKDSGEPGDGPVARDLDVPCRSRGERAEIDIADPAIEIGDIFPVARGGIAPPRRERILQMRDRRLAVAFVRVRVEQGEFARAPDLGRIIISEERHGLDVTKRLPQLARDRLRQGRTHAGKCRRRLSGPKLSPRS